MTGPRYVFAHGGKVLAELRKSGVSAARAKAFGLKLATALGHPIGWRVEVARRNPTLVHHGRATAAKFHILSQAGAAIADVYTASGEMAREIAQVAANALGVRVRVLRNIMTGAGSIHTRMAMVPPLRRNPKGRKPRPSTAVATFVKQLRADADDYHFDRITYEEHGARNRKTWAAIERAGLQRQVSAKLRHPNPARSSGARAKRAVRRSTLRRQAQGIGGRRTVRALARGQQSRARYHALQSKYRYQARHSANPKGPRVVYNRLLGGWYVVVGPHQAPLNGRFNTKAEAQAWLAGGAGRRANPGRDPELDAAVSRIRAGLRRRTGRSWTVTRGRGSVYGWIYIKTPSGELTAAEQHQLAKALGLATVHHQGVMIPSGGRERGEYVARAEGSRTPNPKGRRRRNPRDPVIGEIWTTARGGRCKVIGVAANRIQVVHTETGNREWIDRAEFMASYKPLGARTANPKGRCARNPRATFQPGERVTVPYSGRSSYFGRTVKKTREPATVEGVNTDGTVLVSVKRGRSLEQHTFEPHLVRRRPRKGGAARRERGQGVRRRIELQSIRRRYREAQASAERARRDRDCAEAKAKALDIGEAERTRLLGQIRRLTAEIEAQGAIASELERQDPSWRDPWAPVAVANPRGSERARAVKTYRKWHEFDAHKVTMVPGPPRVLPKTMVRLGEVRGIVYDSDKYAGGPDNPRSEVITYEHETKRPRPLLVTDPDGRHVHIIGGKMKVTADGLVN